MGLVGPLLGQPGSVAPAQAQEDSGGTPHCFDLWEAAQFAEGSGTTARWLVPNEQTTATRIRLEQGICQVDRQLDLRITEASPCTVMRAGPEPGDPPTAYTYQCRIFYRVEARELVQYSNGPNGFQRQVYGRLRWS